MSDFLDPLTLIREASITGAAVQYEDKHYIFGTHKIHEMTQTCFKRTPFPGAQDYYYTLRDVIVYLENADSAFSEYRKLCVTMKITGVYDKDRSELKGYLKGDIETCPQIDLEFLKRAQSTPQSAPPNTVSTANAVVAPQISIEEMHEQKLRHAALIDQSTQRQPTISAPQSNSSTAAGGLSADKLEELRLLRRSQKRKDVQVETTDGLDPGYIKADQQILKVLRADELPAYTRSSVLCKAGADFSFALKLFNDSVLRPKDVKAAAQLTTNYPGTAVKAAAPGASVDASRRFSTGGHVGTGMGGGGVYATPIILVPAAASSVLSAVNVADFLEKGEFISAEEKRKSGAKREQEQLIRRTMPSGVNAEFRVLDNAKALRPEEWSKVVAVFATGQLWQFKEFKWTNAVTLFQEVLGVHVMMDDRDVDSNVQSWNCKVLKINQHKRHLDAGAANEFWGYLEKFLKEKKPWLIKRSGPEAATKLSSQTMLSTKQGSSQSKHR